MPVRRITAVFKVPTFPAYNTKVQSFLKDFKLKELKFRLEKLKTLNLNVLKVLTPPKKLRRRRKRGQKGEREIKRPKISHWLLEIIQLMSVEKRRRRTNRT